MAGNIENNQMFSVDNKELRMFLGVWITKDKLKNDFGQTFQDAEILT